jgi:hypothetical protein
MSGPVTELPSAGKADEQKSVVLRRQMYSQTNMCLNTSQSRHVSAAHSHAKTSKPVSEAGPHQEKQSQGQQAQQAHGSMNLSKSAEVEK